jgi:cytochrome P450
MRYIFGIDKSLIVDDSNEYRIFNFIDNLSFFEHLFTNDNNLEVDKLAFLIKNLITKKQLSIEEASVISNIIWFGGIDSPRSLIASMMYELIKYPNVTESIKDSKVLQIKFIEECLRLYPSIKKIIRNSKTDTTINNIFIAKGSRIYLDVYTANRDRNKFEDPNQISFEKNKTRHISFGYGVAQCIGMGLARLEAKIALEYVLEILPYATLIEIKFIKHNQDPIWSEFIEKLSLNIKK